MATQACGLDNHLPLETAHSKEEEVDSLGEQFGTLKLGEIRPVLEIKSAHQDDIHGFIPLGENFVSGSKDTTVKIWSHQGELHQTLSPPVQDYSHWVTALAPLREEHFAIGTRDGLISISDSKGRVSKDFTYAPTSHSQSQYHAKERNKKRINCIVESPPIGNEGSMIFTGTPKFIQRWNPKTGRMLKYWKADDNDWVYCIEPLSANRLITVIGSRMELWSNVFSRAMQKQPMIQEGRANKRQQRPHISAILRLPSDQNQMACALFDGSVRVVDINARKETHFFQEHQRRVWSVVELAPNTIVSSADDKTIKLWDLRQQKSQITIGNNPGRVSSLLKISPEQFISGSCPDAVFKAKEKASIRFWDIRQLIGE